MKKVIIPFLSFGLMFSACGDDSPLAEDAAIEICDCMSEFKKITEKGGEEALADLGKMSEMMKCMREIEQKEEYKGLIKEDLLDALEDRCPDVHDLLEED